jgi:hypothetical protein
MGRILLMLLTLALLWNANDLLSAVLADDSPPPNGLAATLDRAVRPPWGAAGADRPAAAGAAATAGAAQSGAVFLRAAAAPDKAAGAADKGGDKAAVFSAVPGAETRIGDGPADGAVRIE